MVALLVLRRVRIQGRRVLQQTLAIDENYIVLASMVPVASLAMASLGRKCLASMVKMLPSAAVLPLALAAFLALEV